METLGKWFFPIFKYEPLGTPEAEHRIHSAIFHDLDEYVPADLRHLKALYTIDENELRKRLAVHLDRLKALARQ